MTAITQRSRLTDNRYNLQVVELPKEKPEEPLKLFADVPNLQILVMGGDGTAGWILSCLDAMQEAHAQLPEPQMWSPPPVAVIPLGTGFTLPSHLSRIGAAVRISGSTVPSPGGMLDSNPCLVAGPCPSNFTLQICRESSCCRQRLGKVSEVGWQLPGGAAEGVG